jgi:hypothetical protein
VPLRGPSVQLAPRRDAETPHPCGSTAPALMKALAFFTIISTDAMTRKKGESYLAPDGKRYPVEIEKTAQGLQIMLGDVRPPTMRGKAQWLADQPMMPRRRQKPCDVGLFDSESRKQLDLFAPPLKSRT